MDMKTTWVMFTPTEDGFRARPLCGAVETPTGCCTLVKGKCVDTDERR
jgi:hypothetical protein